MADFDVIVVGGGHNGLTCGAYLARSGLRVAVVEETDVIGGGTKTEELTTPGFRHNSCANFFIGFDVSPVPTDLDLKSHGFDFLIPDTQQAFVYDDQTALVVRQDLEPTLASISRLSSSDAQVWEDLYHRLWQARALFASILYNPPSQAPSLSAAAVSEGFLTPDFAEELKRVRAMSPFSVIDDYFENEKIRVVFKKLVHVVQATDSPGFGTLFLGLFLNLTRMCLPLEGAVSLPRALASVIAANGGTVMTGRRVQRVVVGGGRTTGVELSDGDLVETEKAVVAGIDFPQLTHLVGEEHFPSEVIDKARSWDWTSAHSLVTLHLALSQPPVYRASEYDPGVQDAFNVTFGVNNSEDLRRSMADIAAGSFPSIPAGNGSCNSLFDPSYAPDGKHSAFWWPFAPYVVDGTERNWERRRDEYNQRLLARWRDFAPNLTDDNLVETWLRTPLDVAEENASMQYGSVRMGGYTTEQWGVNRPHPKMADYRVPWVRGLYHCGSTSPNGGGVNCAPGYAAAGAIVDDLDVDRWWPHMTLQRARDLGNPS